MERFLLSLVIISFLSKIVGFGREISLAHYFGAGSISDAYLISLTIPVVIFTMFGTTISTGFIPIYNKVCTTRGGDAGNRFTNKLINSMLILTTIFVILGSFFTKQIVLIFAIGFDNETLSLAIQYTRISFFSIYFTMINSVLVGYLQTKEKYIYPELIGFLSNFVIILSIVIGAHTNNVTLAYGSVVAALFQTIFLLFYSYRDGYRYRFELDILDTNIIDIFKMATPLFIGLSATQINIIVDKSIASAVAIGGISALNYADRLNSFVLSSLVMSLSAIVYPNLSKKYVSGNLKAYTKIISNATMLILIVLIPTIFGTCIYSTEIISLVFSGGAFNESAVRMTSVCLAFYSLGIIGMGLNEILKKVFYSMENTKTPTTNSIAGIFLNIVLSVLLSKKIGVYGIALATSITANFTTCLLFVGLVKKIKDINFVELIIVAIKLVGFSATSGFFSYIVFNSLRNIINGGIALVMSGILFIFIYLIMLTFGRIAYVNDIIESIKAVFKKNDGHLFKTCNSQIGVNEFSDLSDHLSDR